MQEPHGTYNVTAQIPIAYGMTVTSLNGAAVTTVRRSSGTARVFSLSHAGAVLEGLTVADGNPGTGASGGNIYMTAGTVQSCVITNGYADYSGGGIYMTGGMLRNSVIVGNRAKSGSGDFRHYGGGGVALATPGNGTVRNCLIAGNRVDLMVGPNRASGGAGIWVHSGTWTVQNCTIARNLGSRVAGGIYREGGTLAVVNSVIYENRAEYGTSHNTEGTMTVTYSCTVDQIRTGTGNTSSNPAFVEPGTGYGASWSGGNLRLGAASPCIDTGSSLSAFFTDDLEGTTRPLDGNGDGTAEWDMGAYEKEAGGPLDAVFSANRVYGFTPQPVIFTAVVSGGNTNNLGFTWDFKDSQVQSGPGLLVVTNTFLSGDYTPTLTVTNGAGESVTKSLVNPAEVIRISPLEVFVKPGALNQAPYDTWEKAAATIQSAVDWGHGENGTGTVVWVADGTYTLSANVTVPKAVTVRSVNGPDAVTLNGGGTTRAFYVTAAATIEGFTITNGYHASNGGGAYLAGGRMIDCRIVRCRTPGSSGDAGVFGGGGLTLAAPGGLVRNCLIVGNHVNELGHDSGGGGGIHVLGGTWRIESSTITRNFAGGHATRGAGGGILRVGGTVTVTNSIVYFNQTNRTGTHNLDGVTAVSYSCTTPLTGLTGANNIEDEPGLVESGSGYGAAWSGGDLQLAEGSPCIDQGVLQEWMAGARDLAGLPRLRKAVDMGAYEWHPPPGMVIWIR